MLQGVQGDDLHQANTASQQGLLHVALSLLMGHCRVAGLTHTWRQACHAGIARSGGEESTAMPAWGGQACSKATWPHGLHCGQSSQPQGPACMHQAQPHHQKGDKIINRDLCAVA